MRLELDTYCVVFYDNECGFCDKTIQFVLQNNPDENLKFLALQSELGIEILKRFEVPFDLTTIIVLKDKKVYTKSKAVFEILNHTNGHYKSLRFFRFVPSFLSDYVYDIIAKYRYLILGKTNSCMLPSKEQQEHFL